MLGMRARQMRPFRAPLVMDQLTCTRFFFLIYGPKSLTVEQVFLWVLEPPNTLKALAWTSALGTDCDLQRRLRKSTSVRCLSLPLSLSLSFSCCLSLSLSLFLSLCLSVSVSLPLPHPHPLPLLLPLLRLIIIILLITIILIIIIIIISCFQFSLNFDDFHNFTSN